MERHIAKRLGIVGVHAPAPKVYEMMQQGVIEGVFMPLETMNSFKLREVTKYATEIPGGLYMTSFFIVMNPKALAKMSKKDQAAFMRVSGENLTRIWGEVWEKQDPPAVVDAKKLGVEISTASPQLAAGLRERLKGMEEDWIAKANKRGVDGAAALAFMKAEIKTLKGK